MADDPRTPVRGAEDLARFFAWGADKMPEDTAKGLTRAGIVYESGYKENVNNKILNRQSGRLIQGIGVTSEDNGQIKHIGTNVFYAATHEGQAKGVEGDVVVISAKGDALVFPDTRPGSDGGFTTVKQVRIPIRRPLGITFEEKTDEALAEVEFAIERGIRRGGK